MKHRGDLMNGEAPLLAGLDLVKAHGRTPALRGASVALAAGEILAVTGGERQREVHAAARWSRWSGRARRGWPGGWWRAGPAPRRR